MMWDVWLYHLRYSSIYHLLWYCVHGWLNRHKSLSAQLFVSIISRSVCRLNKIYYQHFHYPGSLILIMMFIDIFSFYSHFCPVGSTKIVLQQCFNAFFRGLGQMMAIVLIKLFLIERDTKCYLTSHWNHSIFKIMSQLSLESNCRNSGVE